MTKVTISETYAVGCNECAATLDRLVTWSIRDNQVTGLTFKAVARCEHALQVAKAERKLPAIITGGHNSQQPPPPPGGSGLFPVPEISPQSLAGTGYDEPTAASAG